MTCAEAGEGPAGLTRLKRLRFLAKDVAFYGGASVVSKSFFLITLPLLTRYFALGEYGAIDLLNALVLFLSTLVILGQDSAVARYFYDDSDDKARRQVVSQSLVIQLAGAVVATVALWLVVDLFPVPLATDADRRWLLRIVALQLPFLVLLNFSQNLLKWTFARRRFAVVSLGQAAAHAALLVAAIVGLHAGIIAVFAISLATRAAFGLLGLYFCRRWLASPRGAGLVRPLVTYAVPFGLIGAVGTFVPVMERSAVGTLVGSAELGIYAAGAAVAMIVSLPIQAFQTAWGPFSLAIHKEADAGRSYDHVLKAFTLTVCLVLVALAALAPLLLRVIAGAPFVAGAIVVLPLAFGLAVQGISWITEVGIGISKRSHLQLYAYAAFLAVAGIGVVVLARPLGILGVALGVMLGHVAKAATATALAQLAYPLPWSFGRVGGFVASTATLSLAVAIASARLGAGWGVLAGLAAGGILLLMAWSRLLSAEERGRLAGLLS